MRGVMTVALVSLGLSGFLRAQDLQPIPTEEVRVWAGRLISEVDKVNTSPVKIAADVDLANGIQVPEMLGVMVVPQKDLKEGEELAAKSKSDCGAPLAYLLMYRVMPLVGGKAVTREQLREVKLIDNQGESHQICVVPLAMKQVADDDCRLLGYGADDKPLIDTKFKQGSESGSGSVTVAVKDTDETKQEGTVEITVFGKFQASFRAAYVEEG